MDNVARARALTAVLCLEDAEIAVEAARQAVRDLGVIPDMQRTAVEIGRANEILKTSCALVVARCDPERGDHEPAHADRTRRVDLLLVRTLSAFMAEKLALNGHKGHWGTMSRAWLLGRLKDEVAELERAILHEESSSNVWREAADVANFAAMLADWPGRRGEG